MYEVKLPWKAYSVNLNRLHINLKSLCSEDYDGLVASNDFLSVILKNENQPDTILISNHWNSITQESEAQLTQYEISLLAQQKIKKCIDFGQTLMIKFAGENVAMGITQASKTKPVADYLADATRYLQSGSLYEVVHETDRLILEGIPSELSPFVTEERLTSFKNDILTFLSTL